MRARNLSTHRARIVGLSPALLSVAPQAGIYFTLFKLLCSVWDTWSRSVKVCYIFDTGVHGTPIEESCTTIITLIFGGGWGGFGLAVACLDPFSSD